jgi:DNA-binding MarR family transcriptional regulator
MTARGGAESAVETAGDPVEWTRERWAEEGQAAPEHFAAMASLMRAHQQMTAVLDEVLKAHDLTRTGYLLLSTLRVARAHSRPLGRLGRQMMVHPTTVTLVIDQLEKRGLVVRTRHASDRRTILAQLTPDGEVAVTRATVDLAAQGFGLGGIGTEQAERLVSELATVRRAQGDIDAESAPPHG